jgi:hypothetical protein
MFLWLVFQLASNTCLLGSCFKSETWICLMLGCDFFTHEKSRLMLKMLNQGLCFKCLIPQLGAEDPQH